MNKKILFVCYGLGVGGIEKCLVNLLNAMPESYDIDVLLMNPQHTFKNQIERKVQFIDTFDYVLNIEDTMTEIKNRGGILRNFGMVLSYCLFRLRIKLRRNAWVGFKPLPKEYDIAVAYSHHDFSPYYVIDKVKAKKKVMWYHNGVYELNDRRYARDQKYYTAFDKVVAVSSDCAKMLSEKFDFRDGQLLILKNLCDAAQILERASQPKPTSFSEDCVHIVTVGRMTSEKGVDLALDVCKKLHDEGRAICWHWVGSGNQADTVRDKIEQMGLTAQFILEGDQENPYPFMRYADIYVQPSYYEAYSTTITEAKVLCRPIVATDVGGMRDQLSHGINGLIVPIHTDELVGAIKTLMDKDEMRVGFSAALGSEAYGSECTMQEYLKTVFS